VNSAEGTESQWNRCGGLRKMETGVASRSISATIRCIDTKTAGSQLNSLALELQSCSATPMPPPSLFGESISTTQSLNRKASSAPSSATKAKPYRPSLSDRLTPSLISAGLVRGTTPKSIRRRLGAVMLDIAFSKPGGEGADSVRADY